MAESPLPLILTLKLDPTSFSYFNHLRQQYFPSERNYLSAHVTLFHALPGEQEASLRQTIEQVCSQTPVLCLSFPKLRFLGQGVAVEVHCPELLQCHRQLAQRWQGWLTRQDQQGYRPHITIQNKTAAPQARQLYDQLSQDWRSLSGYGEGLLLWRYRGGPWEWVQEFSFG